MHSTLRSLFLHIICCTLVHASAPDWSVALQDKIIMPEVQSKKIDNATTTTVSAITYHPLTNALSICKFMPVLGAPNIATIKTYEPEQHLPIKTTHFCADFICLSAADDKGDTIAIGATNTHVRVHRLTQTSPGVIPPEAEPLIKLRVKDPIYAIKACTITPSATALALCAQHRDTGKTYFGLAKFGDNGERAIRTISSTCIANHAPITAFALSDDGKALACATIDHYLTIIHIGVDFFDGAYPGSKYTDVRYFYDRIITSLAWKPDKTLLAASMLSPLSKQIAFISPYRGQIIHRTLIPKAISACAFIDNNKLAVCSEDTISTYKFNRIDSALINYIWNCLSPAARSLCEKTAQYKGPYTLAFEEIAIYESLPALLKRTDLFALPTTN